LFSLLKPPSPQSLPKLTPS
jgi:chromosome segregation ATPase